MRAGSRQEDEKGERMEDLRHLGAWEGERGGARSSSIAATIMKRTLEGGHDGEIGSSRPLDVARRVTSRGTRTSQHDRQREGQLESGLWAKPAEGRETVIVERPIRSQVEVKAAKVGIPFYVPSEVAELTLSGPESGRRSTARKGGQEAAFSV